MRENEYHHSVVKIIACSLAVGKVKGRWVGGERGGKRGGGGVTKTTSARRILFVFPLAMYVHLTLFVI